jgi:hypothetical protein
MGRVCGIYSYVGEKRNAYRHLVGKSEGKRLPKIPVLRWEDNILMDF